MGLGTLTVTRDFLIDSSSDSWPLLLGWKVVQTCPILIPPFPVIHIFSSQWGQCPEWANFKLANFNYPAVYYLFTPELPLKM